MEARRAETFGARSERSGDDSAVPALLGRETPTLTGKASAPATPAAPTPSPRSRSGASHGEELFAERPPMLISGMARARSVPPPEFDGRCQAELRSASTLGKRKPRPLRDGVLLVEAGRIVRLTVEQWQGCAQRSRLLTFVRRCRSILVKGYGILSCAATLTARNPLEISGTNTAACDLTGPPGRNGPRRPVPCFAACIRRRRWPG